MAPTTDRIEHILSRVRGPAVLNIGCVGEAEAKFQMHMRLCESFPRLSIWGIDTDQEGIQQLREKGYTVSVGDAEVLRLGRTFDTIVAGELIEHLANPGRFLEACARVLNPGGTLVLSTPNPFSAMYSFMYWKNHGRAFNPGHACWFCPQTLEQLAARCGFRFAELSFVDDLSPESVGSRWYKSFAHCWKLVRPLFPKRLRNTMVVVLQSLEPCTDRSQLLSAVGR